MEIHSYRIRSMSYKQSLLHTYVDRSAKATCIVIHSISSHFKIYIYLSVCPSKVSALQFLELLKLQPYKLGVTGISISTVSIMQYNGNAQYFCIVGSYKYALVVDVIHEKIDQILSSEIAHSHFIELVRHKQAQMCIQYATYKQIFMTF